MEHLINHLKAIKHLSEVINNLDTVEKIAATIANDIIKYLGYEDCVIYTINKTNKDLVQIAAFGDKKSFKNKLKKPLTIKFGENIVGKVAQTGKPLKIDDTDKASNYLIDDKKRFSELAVPIKIDDTVIGVIDTEHSQKNFYTEADLITLETIANIISLKLYRNLLENEEKKDLFELKEFLSLTINYSKSAILLEDTERKILATNQSFCNVLNPSLTPTHLVGLSTLELANLNSDIFKNKEKFIERIIELKNNSRVVLNERIEINNNRTYLRDFIPVEFNNTIIAYFYQYNDITDTVKDHKRIEKALEQETKYNRLNKNLISIASHELRTPLTSIKSTVDLLLSNSDKFSKEQILERLNRIERASSNMNQLIDDIMTLGKLENFNTLEVENNSLSVLDLKNMIDEIVDDHFPSRDIIFEYLEEVKNITFNILKNKLHLVLNNILSNADKYSIKNSSISVKFKLQNTFLVIQIIDQGVGIPKNQLNTIFDSFTRGSNVNNTKGSGLGLAIAKQATNIIGGKLEIESEINKGTTVSLFIKIK